MSHYFSYVLAHGAMEPDQVQAGQYVSLRMRMITGDARVVARVADRGPDFLRLTPVCTERGRSLGEVLPIDVPYPVRSAIRHVIALTRVDPSPSTAAKLTAVVTATAEQIAAWREAAQAAVR